MTDYDRRWVRRRELYWQSHERRCARCGSLEAVLLHHASYCWPLGEEPDDVLVPLCPLSCTGCTADGRIATSSG